MLGPFEISSVIGVGGMGTVLRATHPGTGDDVAIKVLRSDFAGDVTYLEGFHQEVRTMARMNHPGIVPVYDHGIVPAEVGDGRKDLATGAPWVAMRYISGGSLEEHRALTTWSELRSLLMQVLDALAHAHARDLVHRDLKPGNILGEPTEAGQRWLLTDFGITHIRDPRVSTSTADVTAVSAGTPLYMSPEQVQGEWRDYGPWTDLYALGCIAYECATGRPPFQGESPFDIVMQHVDSPPPGLTPRFGVPPGFQNWVHRLLAKEIPHRYRYAADAAADLHLLGEPEALSGAPPPAVEKSGEPMATLATILEMPPEPTLHLQRRVLHERTAEDRFVSGKLPEPDPGPRLPRIIRLPPDWRTQKVERPPVMPGVGKGLFSLRSPPLSGRVEERDHLWQILREVIHTEEARCVLISGHAGLGKSRLMHWLAHRAEELGAAHVIQATHSPVLNTTEGLSRAFQSYLTATGLSRRPLYQRLRRAYAAHFADDDPNPLHLGALVEWMHPAGADEEEEPFPKVTLDTPRERHLLGEAVIHRIQEDRPVIFCVDDGHWAEDTLAFARHLMVSSRDRPILILITYRPEALADRPMEAGYLEILRDYSRTTELPLSPLEPESQQELLLGMLGLSEDLTRRIATHTGGVPLFAVQLLEDWVQRQVLEPSPAGYVLPGGEELPGDLQSLLIARIEECVGAYRTPHYARVALQCAATLGIDLDPVEWRSLCVALEIPLNPALIDHLLVYGILSPREEGWRFRLPSYRDVIESLSRDTARWGGWSELNWRCARVVDDGTPASAERRARHLLAARRYEEALDLLQRAIDQRCEESAYLQALALLDLLEECLTYVDDRSAREFMILHRAEALRYRGSFDQAVALLEELLAARPAPSLLARAEAHRIIGVILDFRGEYRRAMDRLLRARELFAALSHRKGLAKTAYGLGWVYANLGRVPEARRTFEEGIASARAGTELLAAAWCLQGLAEISLFTHDRAGKLPAREALSLFEAHGCRSGMGLIHRCLGDFARHDGDFEAARDHYRKARYLAGSTGAIHTGLPRLLLALCDVEERNYGAAARRFERLVNAGADRIFPMYRPLLTVGSLLSAIHRGDEAAVADRWAHLQSTLPDRSPLTRDLAMLLDETAEIAGPNRPEIADELARRARKLRQVTAQFPGNIDRQHPPSQ